MNVSVVIPCYNSASFLRSTVQSALAQTHPPLEIICVDDASTDATWELLTELEHESGGIVRPLRHEVNKGTPAAGRNTAIAAAKGDWIAFLDHDDLWLPNKLEIQNELLAANPEAQLLHTACWEQFEDDESSRKLTDILRATPSGDSFRALYARNFVSCLTAIVRRDVFTSLGPLKEDRPYIGVDDYDLWLRMTLLGMKLTYSSQPTAVWRRHSANVSGDRVRQIDGERLVLQEFAHGTHSVRDRIEPQLVASRSSWLLLEKAFCLAESGDLQSAAETLDRFWPTTSVSPPLMKLRLQLRAARTAPDQTVKLLRKAWKKYRKRTLGML